MTKNARCQNAEYNGSVGNQGVLNMEKVRHLLLILIVSIIIFPLLTNAQTPQYVALSKAFDESSNRSPLLSGSRIVAGDLTKNEFYILGANESAPVKPAVAIQKQETIQIAPVIHTASIQKKHILLPQKHLAASAPRKNVISDNANKIILSDMKLMQRSLHAQQLANKKQSQSYEIKSLAVNHKAKTKELPTKVVAAKKPIPTLVHKQFTFQVIKLAFYSHVATKKQTAKHGVAMSHEKSKRKIVAFNKIK